MLIIAIVGNCLAVQLLLAGLSTSALAAMPQEPRETTVDERQKNNSFQSSDIEEAKDSLADAEEDKWALDDGDRMTDDEMNKELFGDDAESEKELDLEKLSSEDDENDSDTVDDSAGDGESADDDREREKKQQKLAPRQTIETYLQNINALTVDTFTPPSDSQEGIDVPTRIMPPMLQTGNRSYRVTDVRYQTLDIYHNPLYFEDRSAERGGVVHGLRQPIVSARKFVGDVVTLPRKKHQKRPRSCEYHQNLRYSQPGLIRN